MADVDYGDFGQDYDSEGHPGIAPGGHPGEEHFGMGGAHEDYAARFARVSGDEELPLSAYTLAKKGLAVPSSTDGGGGENPDATFLGNSPRQGHPGLFMAGNALSKGDGSGGAPGYFLSGDLYGPHLTFEGGRLRLKSGVAPSIVQKIQRAAAASAANRGVAPVAAATKPASNNPFKAATTTAPGDLPLIPLVPISGDAGSSAYAAYLLKYGKAPGRGTRRGGAGLPVSAYTQYKASHGDVAPGSHDSSSTDGGGGENPDKTFLMGRMGHPGLFMGGVDMLGRQGHPGLFMHGSGDDAYRYWIPGEAPPQPTSDFDRNDATFEQRQWMGVDMAGRELSPREAQGGHPGYFLAGNRVRGDSDAEGSTDTFNEWRLKNPLGTPEEYAAHRASVSGDYGGAHTPSNIHNTAFFLGGPGRSPTWWPGGGVWQRNRYHAGGGWYPRANGALERSATPRPNPKGAWSTPAAVGSIYDPKNNAPGKPISHKPPPPGYAPRPGQYAPGGGWYTRQGYHAGGGWKGRFGPPVHVRGDDAGGPMPAHMTPAQIANVIAALIEKGDPRGESMLRAVAASGDRGDKLSLLVLAAIKLKLAKTTTVSGSGAVSVGSLGDVFNNISSIFNSAKNTPPASQAVLNTQVPGSGTQVNAALSSSTPTAAATSASTTAAPWNDMNDIRTRMIVDAFQRLLPTSAIVGPAGEEARKAFYQGGLNSGQITQQLANAALKVPPTKPIADGNPGAGQPWGGPKVFSTAPGAPPVADQQAAYAAAFPQARTQAPTNLAPNPALTDISAPTLLAPPQAAPQLSPAQQAQAANYVQQAVQQAAQQAQAPAASTAQAQSRGRVDVGPIQLSIPRGPIPMVLNLTPTISGEESDVTFAKDMTPAQIGRMIGHMVIKSDPRGQIMLNAITRNAKTGNVVALATVQAALKYIEDNGPKA